MFIQIFTLKEKYQQEEKNQGDREMQKALNAKEKQEKVNSGILRRVRENCLKNKIKLAKDKNRNNCKSQGMEKKR